jgi:hypothetical protein
MVPRAYPLVVSFVSRRLAGISLHRSLRARARGQSARSRLQRNPNDFYRHGRINEDWQRAFRNRAPDAPCRFRFPEKFVARVGEQGEDRNVRADASRAVGTQEGDE